MNLRMANVDGKIVEVISEKEYLDKWKMFADNPAMSAETAIEVADENGENYLLPFRSKTDDRPGIYQDGSVYFTKFPDTEETASQYRMEDIKDQVVDFQDVSTMNDFFKKNEQIRQMEINVLTDIDSIYTPRIGPDDTPEMRAFKEAIISKRIDIDRYAPRFGSNFLNDKRILKTGSITMNKLVSMCENLDIEAELTLRDASGDVANPMGKPITVVLTGAGGDEA